MCLTFALALNSSFLLIYTLEVAGYNPSPWVSAINVWELDEGVGSWLWSGSVLVVVGILRVKQVVADLCYSVSIFKIYRILF